ncbi:MAG: hypothetical protein ACI84D_001686 [Thalassolituus oleivorans]|jgi:hypothetical protein
MEICQLTVAIHREYNPVHSGTYVLSKQATTRMFSRGSSPGWPIWNRAWCWSQLVSEPFRAA